jgi:hypothetical protein
MTVRTQSPTCGRKAFTPQASATRSEKRTAPMAVVVSRNSMTITDRGGPIETSSAARCTK